MQTLSATCARIAPSPTIAMTQAARDLAAAGRDIVQLTAGEPDFDTPPHVADAAIAAIRAGHTRYTAVDGIAPLKSAIADAWARDTGLMAEPAQISVGTGGKQVIFNALLASLNPADQVVIPAPYWVSYPDMVRLTGAQPVIVPPARRLDPDAVARAITPASRWLILNGPGNPSGTVYTRADLQAVAGLMRAHPRLMVLSDDIYSAITYDAPFVTLAQVAPDLAARIVTVNGVSKSHAMTGWRIGWGIGPDWLIAGMRMLQGQSTSNPCSVAQHAALAALTGPQDHLETWRGIYRARRDRVVAGLNACAGVTCPRPDGAFYAFADISQALARSGFADDAAFAMALLDRAGVGTVPGSAFGAPGHLRISFAASDAVLDRGVARMQAFCAAL